MSPPEGFYTIATIYSWKVWWGEVGESTLFRHLAKKVWQISRSTKRSLIVSTNLVWGIMDNSPNSPHFPLPNFPAIRYIHSLLIFMFVKCFLTEYWNTQLMQSLLLWSKLWLPKQTICTSTFGHLVAYKIC